MAKTDEKTLALIGEVKKRKEEIAKLEKPQWKTNCTFSFSGFREPVNIHVEADIRKLIDIAGFLIAREQAYIEAAKQLQVESPPFEWTGFSVKDWLEDIKTRIDKLQIQSKKKKLETLENRLNKIVSPELRAQMELDAIAAELG